MNRYASVRKFVAVMKVVSKRVHCNFFHLKKKKKIREKKRGMTYKRDI